MRFIQNFWLGFILLFSQNSLLIAQSLQGKVLNENKEPITYASIFVKEVNTIGYEIASFMEYFIKSGCVKPNSSIFSN